MKISFVIPCYRSEGLVGKVISEIYAAADATCVYEIIAVDDCSPDNVLAELKAYAQNDDRLKVIALAKNSGKHSALMAGFSIARGDIIVCVDDDGQCPLNRLDDLLAPLYSGYDISIARYGAKKQSGFKNFGSAVNAKMACWLLDKPGDLQLSNFVAMKSFVCREILRYKNAFPYIDGLMLRATSHIANVDMEERSRISGTSGYTFFKSLRLFANGFTAFSVKPLRVATMLGAASALIGFAFGVIVVVRKIARPDILAGYSSLMAMLLLIGGLIMLLLGVIGEYIGRIYICLNNAPQYVIRETINCDPLSEDTP